MTAPAVGPVRLGELRARVREVAATARAERMPFGTSAWMNGHCPRFSEMLAGAGLTGLTWPTRFGGDITAECSATRQACVVTSIRGDEK
jgi:alkylation response protein AidB-like acyl-CoA dehydrogenase